MIKKTIYLSLLAIPLFMMARLPEKSSSGAPASHTGAPGEATCATSGCHDDNTVNSGNAVLSIDIGAVTHYTPGQIYPVKIRITEGSVTRFGFELVALVNGDSSNAGTLRLIDTKRTQLSKNQYILNRQYATYTFNGTDAVSSGSGEWTINWKAPSTNVGPVTLYAGAVSADDDETDKGDHVYTKSVVLQPL